MTSAIQTTSSEAESLPVWNLDDLYPAIDDSKIERDIKQAAELVGSFAENYAGKVTSLSADVLAGAIKEYEAIEDILGRLMGYAQLLHATDMTTSSVGRFYQDMSEQVTILSTETLFFTVEINQIEDDALAALIESSEALTHYAPWVRDVRAFRPYQLEESLERLLHEKSITGRQSWVRLFDETLASLTFTFDEATLSCAEVLNKLSSPDREIRQKAASSLAKTLGDKAHTFAFILNILAKDHAIENEWRGFETPIASRHIANYIEDEIVTCLIDTVKKNYGALSHRYYQIKAKWLGLDTMEYWDRNAPLPEDDNSYIPWEDAVQKVLSAYEAFSPELAKIGRDFFERGWIDAAPKKGKESGAFSHPLVPSAHPYILMNYQGKTRDIMTLAHELGHGIHQVLSAKQGALMCDTPLTLAETASVFGEQLVFRALLDEEKDPQKRRIMIAGKVEDMLNTVVRQIAFCEFERLLHDERQEGEVSLERICAIWMDIQSESLGSAFHFEEEYQYFWAYISHFVHVPFYVYAYAFGDCLVNALYRQYQVQPDGFQDKYIAMLSAGGSLRHKELLAPFGLDASESDFWQKGLDVIIEFIDELEAS